MLRASMEANTTKSRWMSPRLFGALIGACGFGMELERTMDHYQHPRPGDSLSHYIMMGIIFLFLAVSNSILLVSQLWNIQSVAKNY
jgi:hypothetical protein